MQAQCLDTPDGAAKQVAVGLHVRLPVVRVNVNARERRNEGRGIKAVSDDIAFLHALSIMEPVVHHLPGSLLHVSNSQDL